MSPEILIPGPSPAETVHERERRLVVGEGIYRFVSRRPPEDDLLHGDEPKKESPSQDDQYDEDYCI